MVASCPVNLRDKSGKTEAQDNVVSAMTVSLCSDIADPAERIHAIQESTRSAKAELKAMGSANPIEVPMLLPAPVARNLMSSIGKLTSLTGFTPYNTLVTNVAGIQQPIYLAGVEMVGLMGMGPVVDWSGLIHYVFSYNGRISVSFTACGEMLPDPDVYAECIGESYADLRGAVLEQGSA